jgi:hypothetical protein
MHLLSVHKLYEYIHPPTDNLHSLVLVSYLAVFGTLSLTEVQALHYAVQLFHY